MRLAKFFIVLFVIIYLPACTKSAPRRGGIENVNPVLKIDGTLATLEKKMPDVVVGNFFYFPREPYRFKIHSVSKDGEIVVDLGTNHDVKVGQMLLKESTEAIDMSIIKLEQMTKATSEQK
jgi:hypothetical protein